MGCLDGSTRNAHADWAVCQALWHSTAYGRQVQFAYLSRHKSAQPLDVKTASEHFGSHLTGEARRQLDRAVSDRQTGHISAGLVLLLGLCGYVVDGEQGAKHALAMGLAPGAAARATSSLTWSLGQNARRLSFHEWPELFRRLDTMCRRANISHLPEIVVLPGTHLMNAYASGSRDRSVISVTEGLLAQMTLDEVTAILAHELAHIGNADGETMALASALHRTIGCVALSGLARQLDRRSALSPTASQWVLTNAPAIAELLLLGLSRVRETAADALALELCGNAHALASALEKLERHHNGPISAAFGDRAARPDDFLLSHPPTLHRVDAVRRLS